MLTTFVQWFHAPVFFDNEEKTRRALLLNVVLNMFLIALPVLFTTTVLNGYIPRQERILIMLACAWLAIFGIRLIMLTGRISLAGIAMIAILFAATTLAIYNTGTIRTPATSFYLLIIVAAGLTINHRAIIWMTGVSNLAVFTLLLAEIDGMLPLPSLAVTIVQGITFTVIFILTSVLLYFAIKSIDEALVRVQLELMERMQAKEREVNRRVMMEKVIHIGQAVTEQTSDFRAALFKIWDGVRNELDFDRAAIFLYNPDDGMVQGCYGTNRSGGMSEEWDLKFSTKIEDSFFRTVLSQPNGYYFTQDYAGERNLSLRPGHPMGEVKYYAAVACWSGDKPVGIICVDQLISQRIITDEQLEALRLFAGYAGLAIENTRLNTELEGRMQERENFIKKLEANNAELERFTYTVSHDLRSPIVTIKGFLGFLEKDIQENSLEKIRIDLHRIGNATDKMNTLLSDLLELSRIGRIVNPPIDVDFIKLTEETLETIDGRIRAKNIAVHVSPDLPILHGDHVRLREVLENLIDNAAKYMGDQPDPIIEIGARDQKGEQVIFVKDNGLGIEPQYLTRVFGLFEKLNPTSEGTGIGLALIKRIIEVHGGRIWAESEGIGKGSTFCFTIPDKIENGQQ